VKYRSLVGAVASVVLFATAAAAQVCQGDLSFRGSRKHVGGSLGITDHTTALGGGMTFGHVQGLFGGGSVGMVDYDAPLGSSLALNGGIGYSMPLSQRSKWQVCPGGTLSLGFGPSIDLGGTSAHMSTQTVSLGASFGTVFPMNKSVTMLPFGSVGLGHTNVSLSANGASASNSDTYLMLGFGAGFQLSPTFALRPALGFAVGADYIDDTVFSLGFTIALR